MRAGAPTGRRTRRGLVARLSIRGRLVLLVVLPLLSAVLAAGPFVAVQAFDAAGAGRTADTAATTRAVADVMGELQAERLVVSAFLASPGDDGTAVQRRQGAVDDTVARVRGELGTAIPDEVASALVRIGSVQEVRDIAAVRGTSPDRVARSYHAVLVALVDSLRLVSRQDSDDARGARQLAALDALLRADEFAELRDAALVAVAVDPESGTPLLEDSEVQSRLFVERFVQQADTELAGLVVGVTEGRSAEDVAALGARLPDPGDPRAVEGFAVGVAGVVGTLSQARQGAREQVTALIAESARSRAATAGVTAWVVGLVTAALILLVAFLSVTVSRSIAVPLRRLTDGARDVTGLVTDLAEQELTDIADGDQRGDVRIPQPQPIDVASDDELGRLTAAFNQMRATAVDLIERQIITRQNVSLMFANVAQRTQNLVGRQLALVDELERDEQDAGMLASLYRLDHLSTRLRRNADNLLVVAGVRDEIGVSGPSDLSTALRAALAQIEDYQRVRIADPPDLRLRAAFGADLVLLFAELLENATSFSPPRAGVEVEALHADDGSCEIVIVDHGMGMPPDRLAEENRRLVERERLDVAPTTVLGLFVVGRISRRHGLTVVLTPTRDGGVTARVAVPARLFVRPAHAAPAPAEVRPPTGPTALPAVVIPEAAGGGPFTWFPDEPVLTGRASTGANGFGPRPAPAAPPVAPAARVPQQTGPHQTGPHQTGSQRTSPQPIETRGGLRRREAGAQLPDLGRTAEQPRPDRAPVRPPPHHDPALARSEFGDFEAGFSRAAASPAPAVPVPRPAPADRMPRPRPRPEPAAPAPARAPADQRAGLTRRVPGENMVPELRNGPPRRPVRGEPPQRLRDPGEDRDRFDAFEDAVARSTQHDPTKETSA